MKISKRDNNNNNSLARGMIALLNFKNIKPQWSKQYGMGQSTDGYILQKIKSWKYIHFCSNNLSNYQSKSIVEENAYAMLWEHLDICMEEKWTSPLLPLWYYPHQVWGRAHGLKCKRHTHKASEFSEAALQPWVKLRIPTYNTKCAIKKWNR